MIKRIIVVEDGTVDLDDLQETLGDDTKIIVYRQGSNPPNILELQEPARYAYENERERNRLEKEVSSLNTRLKSLLDENNDLTSISHKRPSIYRISRLCRSNSKSISPAMSSS